MWLQPGSATVQRLVREGDLTQEQAREIVRAAPGVVVLNPEDLLDAFPEAGRTFALGRAFSTAAGAGTRSRVQLFNPTTSDVDCLIRRVEVSCGTLASPFLAWHLTQLGAVGSASVSHADSRRFSLAGDAANGIVAQMRSDNTVGAITSFTIVQNNVIANTLLPFEFPKGLVLRPGAGLTADPAIDNISIFWNVYWEEVPRRSRG